MNTKLILFTFASVSSVICFGQEIGSKYSQKEEVPGLDLVEFPAGEWHLEFRVAPPSPNPSHRPDYFGFRKTRDTLERVCKLPLCKPERLG